MTLLSQTGETEILNLSPLVCSTVTTYRKKKQKPRNKHVDFAGAGITGPRDMVGPQEMSLPPDQGSWGSHFHSHHDISCWDTTPRIPATISPFFLSIPQS
jgi:hypothetical protein